MQHHNPLVAPILLTDGLAFRRAQTADSEAVRRLFDFVHREYGFEADFDDRDRDLMDVGLCGRGVGEFFGVVIREADQALVGCIALKRLNDRDAELGRFYLDPAVRGRGLGTALVGFTLQAAADWGYRRVVLETHTAMTEAMGLYPKLGFERIPTYCGYPIEYSDVAFAYPLERLQQAEARFNGIKIPAGRGA